MVPVAPVVELSSLTRSIRREMLGVLIERDVDMNVVRADLERLITTQVISLQSSVAA